MRAFSLPGVLKKIMEEHGWSQSQLARELGESPMWVSRVVRGDRDPKIGYVADLLDRIGYEVRITPKGKEPGPVKRREFHEKFMKTAAGVALVPSPVGNPFSDPEYVRTLAQRTRTMTRDLGGGPVAATVLGQIRSVKNALAGGGKELHAAASELMREAMWTLYDARQLSTAQQVGGMSLNCARHANDFSAQADTYTALSAISVNRGNGAHGARYAEQALLLPDLTSADQAYAKVHLGRALALIPGKERKARTMFDEARSVAGVPSFQAADISGVVGTGLSELGAHKESQASFNDSVAAMGEWSPLYQARHLGKQVKAALRANEPSLAAQQMFMLAYIAPMITSACVNEDIAQILKASRPWATVPEMRQAREQLTAAAPPPQKAPRSGHRPDPDRDRGFV